MRDNREVEALTSRADRKSSRIWYLRGLVLVASTALALGVAELSVRLTGHVDAEGVFHFHGSAIPPFPLPVERSRRMIDDYLKDDQSFLMWDAELGWIPRPNGSSRTSPHSVNAASIRADHEVELVPPEGVMRIAMFGDSFIFSDDVPLESSLAAQLEDELVSSGLRAEVVNFGVGGYGMDQAYLRYRRDGVRYRPDVVIFGLQLENVSRNVNIFRMLYHRNTGIPFSKPRFVERNGQLELVNHPTIEPDETPEALAGIFDGPLRPYEGFLSNWRPHWYAGSRLASTAMYVLRDRKADFDVRRSLDPEGEAMEVTMEILERLSTETADRDQRLVFVYLPNRRTLSSVAKGSSAQLLSLLARIEERFDVVDPTDEMVEAIRTKGLDQITGNHYSHQGNAVVARVLARRLVEME